MLLCIVAVISGSSHNIAVSECIKLSLGKQEKTESDSALTRHGKSTSENYCKPGCALPLIKMWKRSVDKAIQKGRPIKLHPFIKALIIAHHDPRCHNRHDRFNTGTRRLTKLMMFSSCVKNDQNAPKWSFHGEVG